MPKSYEINIRWSLPQICKEMNKYRVGIVGITEISISKNFDIYENFLFLISYTYTFEQCKPEIQYNNTRALRTISQKSSFRFLPNHCPPQSEVYVAWEMPILTELLLVAILGLGRFPRQLRWEGRLSLRY